MRSWRIVRAALVATVAGCSRATEPSASAFRLSSRVDSIPVPPVLIGAPGVLAVKLAVAVALNDSTVEAQGIVSGTCIPRPSVGASAREVADTLLIVVTPTFVLDVTQPRCALPIYYPYRITLSPNSRRLSFLRLRQVAVADVTVAFDTLLTIR